MHAYLVQMTWSEMDCLIRLWSNQDVQETNPLNSKSPGDRPKCPTHFLI